MAETKKARAKKELSAARKAAMTALKNAGSDQEKTVAKQKLKLVRFQEVASTRTDAAIRTLDNLLNACDTTAYAWTDEQASKIIGVLEPRYSKIVSSLRKPAAKTSTREKFKL